MADATQTTGCTYRFSKSEMATLKDEAASVAILAKIKRRTGCAESGGCEKQHHPNPPGSPSTGCFCLDQLARECDA